MDESRFWAIVESGRARAGGDWTDVPEAVIELLAALELDEIAGFSQLHDELEWQAYREDLWAVCCLINGGFGSDDTFLYFRNWLLVQGRVVWEAALADPDSLADVPQVRAITASDDDFADCEDFLDVANRAWERVTGEAEGLDDALHERGFEPHRDDPVPPAGEKVDFDDRARVYALLPRLSALFYDRAATNRR
jgi:hypothetical protein